MAHALLWNNIKWHQPVNLSGTKSVLWSMPLEHIIEYHHLYFTAPRTIQYNSVSPITKLHLPIRALKSYNLCIARWEIWSSGCFSAFLVSQCVCFYIIMTWWTEKKQQTQATEFNSAWIILLVFALVKNLNSLTCPWSSAGVCKIRLPCWINQSIWVASWKLSHVIACIFPCWANNVDQHANFDVSDWWTEYNCGANLLMSQSCSVLFMVSANYGKVISGFAKEVTSHMLIIYVVEFRLLDSCLMKCVA